MDNYDTIIVGTGFASSFFLHRYLEHCSKSERILVLERGARHDHGWQLEHRKHSDTAIGTTFDRSGDPDKFWNFTIGFGGGSNCWWACTPRMMPNDFRTASVYGVGVDWPFSYDDLAPYYERAETLMTISGPSDGSPFPRRQPYPLPAHRFTAIDRLFKERFPDLFFQQPTARASIGTDQRNQCCANGVCSLCPVDAKFTIANGMPEIFKDPRVDLRLNAKVTELTLTAGRVTGVAYQGPDGVGEARGNLVVLGANAMFNAFLMLKSGLKEPNVGKGVTEQMSINVRVLLDGVDNYDGSTSITGHGYMLYDGPHRSQNAGCLIETFNIPWFRPTPDRWRQTLSMKLIFEELPELRNYIAASADQDKPTIKFEGHSAYAHRGVAWAKSALPKALAGLPIETLEFASNINRSEAHIIGSTVAGNDPETSVVDPNLIHHRQRNLVVLGSSTFPTCAPANPTLTIAAMSLRTADYLFRDGADKTAT